MNSIAVLLLSGLVGLLGLMIMHPRIRFPLLFDFGMFFVMIGTMSVIDNLLTGDGCTPVALVARWFFIGGGLFAMLLSVAMRMGRKGTRRISDMVDIGPSDLHKIRGRGK